MKNSRQLIALCFLVLMLLVLSFIPGIYKQTGNINSAVSVTNSHKYKFVQNENSPWLEHNDKFFVSFKYPK